MPSVELDLLRRRKRDQTVKLMEVSDLTKQLAQAAQRNDRVAMTMLISMRQEPLLQLQEMEASIQKYLLSLPEERAIRAAALLRGEPPQTTEESELCEQTAQYRRLLESVSEMDKRLSVQMGGKQSFYKMFRA